MDVDSDAVRLSLDARCLANVGCDAEYCLPGCYYCSATDFVLVTAAFSVRLMWYFIAPLVYPPSGATSSRRERSFEFVLEPEPCKSLSWFKSITQIVLWSPL